ncbi:MAG: adenosylmethionine decarboxylase [Gammaproteobacteria bacterium]
MNEFQSDHFKEDDNGLIYAGDHTLIELWGAKNLTDPEYIAASLRQAARAAGATILHDHFHHFGEKQGVSGVVILAESHISIHTWPERAYAAIDIFMCGNCDPRDSLVVIEQRFEPASTHVNNILRGVIEPQEQVA